MSTHQQFWKPREVSRDRTCLWRLGGLRIWVQRNETAWRIAQEEGTTYEQMNASIVPNDVVPNSLQWETIASRTSASAFSMHPEMPDQAVVAKTGGRVIVPAGERITYYCLLPCRVRFQLGASDGRSLLDFDVWPTRTLRNTWFGDHSGGMLAYALPHQAGREWSELSIGPHHIIVPVRIENESAEHLAFERFCLRPQYLEVFNGGNVLWSSSVRAHYHGPLRACTLQYGSGAPSEVGNAPSITVPRDPPPGVPSGLFFQ